MKKAPNTVYIGYDPKEDVAYEVLKSIRGYISQSI